MNRIWTANAVGVIATASNSRSVVALDSATGKTLWTYWEPERSVSPIGANEEVVVIASTFRSTEPRVAYFPDSFCALEAESGSVIWCGRGYSYPLKGNRWIGDFLEINVDKGVTVFDPRSGNELWRRDKPVGCNQRYPQVLPSGGDFYQIVQDDVSLLDGISGSVKWRYTLVRGEDSPDARGVVLLMAAADGIAVLRIDQRLAAVGTTAHLE